MKNTEKQKPQLLYSEDEVISILHKMKCSILEREGYVFKPSFSQTEKWFKLNKPK